MDRFGTTLSYAYPTEINNQATLIPKSITCRGKTITIATTPDGRVAIRDRSEYQ